MACDRGEKERHGRLRRQQGRELAHWSSAEPSQTSACGSCGTDLCSLDGDVNRMLLVRVINLAGAAGTCFCSQSPRLGRTRKQEARAVGSRRQGASI